MEDYESTADLLRKVKDLRRGYEQVIADFSPFSKSYITKPTLVLCLKSLDDVLQQESIDSEQRAQEIRELKQKLQVRIDNYRHLIDEIRELHEETVSTALLSYIEIASDKNKNLIISTISIQGALVISLLDLFLYDGNYDHLVKALEKLETSLEILKNSLAENSDEFIRVDSMLDKLYELMFAASLGSTNKTGK